MNGCGCECTSGGFCGGCGHAGCGARNRGGRPAVGPAINMRFPADVLARIDDRAAAAGVCRAEMIRRLVTSALD